MRFEAACVATAFFLCVGLAIAGCGGPNPAPPQLPVPSPGERAHREHHHHHHEAPRGGTLVELGDHVASIEFLLDADAGILRAYFLDGCAENAVPMVAENFPLRVVPGEDRAEFVVTMEAQANPLTGEIVGATSAYTGQSDDLIGLEQFEAHLPEMSMLGVEFEPLAFRFPEGHP